MKVRRGRAIHHLTHSRVANGPLKGEIEWTFILSVSARYQIPPLWVELGVTLIQPQPGDLIADGLLVPKDVISPKLTDRVLPPAGVPSQGQHAP